MEIDELEAFVEDHPDDVKARWRLSKKLYQQKEYRRALAHLEVLRNEWGRKLNIYRYLAATLYRMKRYEEAVRELDEALSMWPEELALHEQLSRVYEVSGRIEDALNAWQVIRKQFPEHERAERQVARLRKIMLGERPEPAGKEKDEPRGADSMLTNSKVCPECGEVNSEAFEQCWNCSARLENAANTPAMGGGLDFLEADFDDLGHPPAAATMGPGPAVEAWSPALIAGAVAAVVLTLAGAAMSYQYVQVMSLHEAGEATIGNVAGFVAAQLAVARTVAGVAMLIVWPCAFMVGLAAAQLGPVSMKRWAVPGLFLGGLTYACLFAPIAYAPYVPLVPMVASLAVLMLGYDLPTGKAFLAWFVQGAIVAAVGATAFVCVEGTEPIKQFPAIMAYAGRHDVGMTPGRVDIDALVPPANMPIQWQSTGSDWLDARANQVELIVECEAGATPIALEVRSGFDVIEAAQLAGEPVRMVLEVEPGHSYHIALEGEGGAVTVIAYGVLEPVTARDS